jgi:hypothetical protein
MLRALTSVDEDVSVVQKRDKERDEGPLEALHEVLEPHTQCVALPPRCEVRADLVGGKVHLPHVARNELVFLEVAVVSSSIYMGTQTH